MTQFLVIYKAAASAAPEAPEDQQAAMAAWGAWMEKVGTHLADPGNPIGKSWTVTASGAAPGGNALPIMGYTILEADSIEAACQLVEGNPMLSDPLAEIEVAPIVPIEM
ncbi:hypothetical protein [Pseudooceanicola algae]|uniref:YCII-related domain-containing protein n=1 Tax=Pseudooceanicola algae TaxID=1537215 RepID=A0A418SB70_9RHOB|nr:hypothetical protein [Pseudooceanicola algae]QPM91364.1 hypothetical protein PSAL_026170 [Pseudooceanicola algae]